MASSRRLTDLAASAAGAADFPSGELVVALSGGPDSAALLWLCRHLDRDVRAVHVHHGLPASDLLAAAAGAVAGAVGIDLRVEEVRVPAGPSPENQARGVRYEALTKAAEHGEWVLTAHTSDDQAETVLDHLLRGSGLDGLRGIPARRPPFARPLLSVSRSTTREMATLAGLPWETDPMNRSPDPLRNRIRSHLLPQLEQYNPRISESLAATARLVAVDADHLEREASAPVHVSDGRAVVAASVVATAAPAVAARLVRRFLARAGLQHASPHAVERTLSVARGEAERQHPGGDLTVRRSGALLVAEKETPVPPPPTELSAPGRTEFPGWRFDAYLADSPPEAMPLSPGWMVADADAVSALRVEPAAAHPGVRGLLAEGGVGKEDRDAYPVVVAEGEVVWVPGIRRLRTGWVDSSTARYLVVRSRTERTWQT